MSLFDDILRRTRWPWRRSTPLLMAPVAPVVNERTDAEHPPDRVFSQPVRPPPAPVLPVRRPRSIAEAPPAGESLFRRLARRADSILNTLSGLGGQYDKGTAGRPDLSRMPLNFQELTALYRYNGYAQRFIDIVPSDATRKGWKVKDSTANVDTMADENKRLHVNKRFHEALQWARLYGGSIIFLVVDEEIPPGFANSPGALLAQPLDWSRVRRVLNLVVLDPSEAQPYQYESDLRSQRFKDVKTWMVSPNTNAATALSGHQIVHHSRIIYFAGKRLPAIVRHSNRGIDDSVLEAIWDQVRNRTSVDQAAALIAQELKLNVMKIQGLAALSTSDQADLFEMRMKMLAKSKSLNNMILLGDGEEFSSLATPMSGFDQLDTNSRESYCAVTGMPAELVFGDAPSGLNTDGESHVTLWGNVIASFQNDRLRDELTYLYGLIFASSEGPTRGVVPEKWDVEFLPLDELTETEQAALELSHAQADAIRVSSQILPPEHIARSRYGDAGYQNEIQPYDPEADAAGLEAEIARLQADQQEARDLGILPAAAVAPGAMDPGAPVIGNTDAVAGLLPDAAVDAFAEKLTRAGVSRCEHGSSNRCRICGIERVRDFETAPDGTPVLDEQGQPMWTVKWRPIYRPVAVTPEEAGDGGLRVPAGDVADVPVLVDAPAGGRMDALVSAAELRRRAAQGADIAVVVDLPPAAVDQWRAARAVAEKLCGALRFSGKPHATVLFLGPVDAGVGTAASAGDASRKVGVVAATVPTSPVAGWRVVALEPDQRGLVPVVLLLDVPGPLPALHKAVNAACATAVMARQFSTYVPHVTLGYAPGTTAQEVSAKLRGATFGRVEWVPADVSVTVGDAVAWVATLGPPVDQ